jgi:predicted transcriptional regulator of viral defense system
LRPREPPPTSSSAFNYGWDRLPGHPVQTLDAEYVFVRLTSRKLFGWEDTGIDGHRVHISTPEKTVADCLDHSEHCGGIEQIARAMYFNHEELGMARVVEYAKRMGNNTILKRLGYILNATSLLDQYADLFEDFRPSAGFTKLDPLSPRSGKHDTRWGLLVNFRLDPEGWRY